MADVEARDTAAQAVMAAAYVGDFFNVFFYWPDDKSLGSALYPQSLWV